MRQLERRRPGTPTHPSSRPFAPSGRRLQRKPARNPGSLLHVYLQEVGSFPLLAPSEERRLARRIREARTCLEDGARPTASPSDGGGAPGPAPCSCREQFRDSVRTLVNANLRLVVHLAKRMARREGDFLDYVQQGNLGLIRAAEKFDDRAGTRFSTYAYWWIKQAMDRYEPPPRATGTDDGTSPNPVTAVYSLDEVLGPDRDDDSVEWLADTRQPSPETTVYGQEVRREVRRALGCLTARERQVVRLRFGIGLPESETLESVGHRLGLSRERIRQIERRALRRLRDSGLLAELAPATRARGKGASAGASSPGLALQSAA